MRRLRPTIVIWLALAPALAVVGLLTLASLAYGVAQSAGALEVDGVSRFDASAYVDLLAGTSPGAREFWPSLVFSLWVSAAATLVSSIAALLLAVALGGPLARGGSLLALNANLAFPHLVWAVALGLLLSQSGLLSRIAAALGLIAQPSAFPVLIRDTYGLGIVLHYVTKETPFLTLIVLALLRTQGGAYTLVAENLGATPWQRLRHLTLPLVLPGLAGGAAVVFAFSFGAYEVPALLGVRYPRALPVLALEFFTNPDLNRRAEGMAISLLMSLVVLAVVVPLHMLRERENAAR